MILKYILKSEYFGCIILFNFFNFEKLHNVHIFILLWNDASLEFGTVMFNDYTSISF